MFSPQAESAPLTYRRDKVEAGPEALVRAHMGIVRRIAWHVYSRVASAIDVEDLVQTGMVALIEAANAFEDQGYAFQTYVSVRVRGAMIDLLRRQASISRSALDKKKQVAAARSRVELELGRGATDAEMAQAMSLEPAAYRALVDKGQGATQESLDDLYSDHSMWFASTDEAADAVIDREALAEALTASIERLPEREALILKLYYVEEFNLEEIGKVMGITNARVCQIKKVALDRLRAHLSGRDLAG
jgi:RNA polymerase sigma factor FliA